MTFLGPRNSLAAVNDNRAETPANINYLAIIDAIAARSPNPPECVNPIVWRQQAASSGLCAIDLPPHLNKHRLDPVEQIRLFARFGEINLELRDVPGIGHAGFLAASGCRRFDPILKRVSEAALYCAIAITEQQAGTDLLNLTCKAVPTEGGYRITGTKCFNARLREASHVIVFSQLHRKSASPVLTAFLLPLNRKGIEIADLRSMGLHGTSFGSLSLNDVRATCDDRIGGEGQAFSIFRKHFSNWRLMTAAAALGCAHSAIDQTIARLKLRHAFGGPIGRFTHLQLGLARHATRLRSAWLLCEATARRLHANQPIFFEAAMCKAESVKAATHAVTFALQTHGAAGYTTQFDLEKRLRDLIGLAFADGTTDVLFGQVARGLLGESLYHQSLNRQMPDSSFADMPHRRDWMYDYA